MREKEGRREIINLQFSIINDNYDKSALSGLFDF